MKDKSTAAAELIFDFIGFDGGHHKQWLLDQVLRVLLEPGEYEEAVTRWKSGEDGPDTYEWDEGIAP